MAEGDKKEWWEKKLDFARDAIEKDFEGFNRWLQERYLDPWERIRAELFNLKVRIAALEQGTVVFEKDDLKKCLLSMKSREAGELYRHRQTKKSELFDEAVSRVDEMEILLDAIHGSRYHSTPEE